MKGIYSCWIVFLFYWGFCHAQQFGEILITLDMFVNAFSSSDSAIQVFHDRVYGPFCTEETSIINGISVETTGNAGDPLIFATMKWRVYPQSQVATPPPYEDLILNLTQTAGGTRFFGFSNVFNQKHINSAFTFVGPAFWDVYFTAQRQGGSEIERYRTGTEPWRSKFILSNCSSVPGFIPTSTTIVTEDIRLFEDVNMVKEQYGHGLAYSVDSEGIPLLFIGHPFREPAGAVWVYRLQDNAQVITVQKNNTLPRNETIYNDQWIQIDVLTPNDGRRQDGFGSSVAVSQDGSIVAVGSPYCEKDEQNPNGEAFPDSGAVYIFNYNSGTQKYQQVQKILSPLWDAATPTEKFLSEFNFGIQLKMNKEGTYLGISCNAPFIGQTLHQNNRRINFYQRTGGTWSSHSSLPQSEFSSSVGSQGLNFDGNDDLTLVAVRAPDEKVKIFERNGASWSKITELTSGLPGLTWYGMSIALSEETLLVGAPLARTVFAYNISDNWNQYATFTINNEANSLFGSSLSIVNTGEQRFLLIGSPVNTVNEKGISQLYIWVDTTTQENATEYFVGWRFKNQYTSSRIYYIGQDTGFSSLFANKGTGDMFGSRLILTPLHAIISANLEGAVYSFRLPLPPVEDIFIEIPPGTIPPTESPIQQNNDRSRSQLSMLLIGVIIGAVVLAAILIGGLVYYMHRRKEQYKKEVEEKIRELQEMKEPPST